VEIGIVKEA